MRDEMPDVHAELIATLERLERAYGDMQDVEFTVEEGQLYFLQTRTGKRTSAAALRIAVDLVEEGVISRDQAITRVEANRLIEVLLPTFLPDQVALAKSEGRLLGKGLAASPGAAIGRIRFEPAEVVAGDILVRVETCPDDIVGFFNANGIVTMRGGMTSHAAVVARGMGKPCVAGCETFGVDLENKVVRVGELVLKDGDVISIDGSTGEIYHGEIATQAAEMSSHFTQLLAWADQRAALKVRANADTPEDARRAREFGAQGIGLCRTEHMFMAEERLPSVRRMILAGSLEARLQALEELLPMQLEDFIGIFKAMNGLPVTIRLLDPPLHEFLPKLVDLVAEVSTLRATGADESVLAEKEALLATVSRLHEVNPMMGLRGCRLGLLYPEINVMQVRAIFLAACHVVKEGGAVEPEIMIPLIGHVKELRVARGILEKVALEVMESEGVVIPYKFGTMIEVPRAALIAGDLAELAEFFSFGTNDLTQMTYGLSRDDSEATILRHYQDGVAGADGEKVKILKDSPFVVLDREGVGRLMRIAASEGRRSRPDLKLGICGEHGGEPNSIAFAHELELAYVSCSPFRVPVARLAAAQAAIAAK
jgi:pyruvate,orthophosphate dikinase